MANINVVAGKPIADGYKLKFRTPCDSTTIEGLVVKYPVKNGVGSAVKTFTFKDAHGTELSGVGNLFVRGVMIEVLLDVTHGVAYIQNADTNSYIESVKSEIKRLEDAQKQFLTKAGKAVEDCENIATSAEGFEQAMKEATERAESVQGVYVGGGDMPEGYSIQINLDGEAFKIDEDFQLGSKNPIQNNVVTAWKNEVDAENERQANELEYLGTRINNIPDVVCSRNTVLNNYGEPIARATNQYVLLYAEIQMYAVFGNTLFKLLFYKKNGSDNVFRSVAQTVQRGGEWVVFQVELSFDAQGNMSSSLYLNNSESAEYTGVVNYAPYIVGLC